MIKRLLITIFSVVCANVFAQSSPGLIYGQVPTPGQWNSYFSAKMDYPGSPGAIGNIWTSNGIGFYSAPPAPALNLSGGLANSIPYQSAANTTTFLSQGTGLLQEVAGAPGWLAFGTSVKNPGTNTIEATIPIQTIGGASHVFVTADLFQKTRRSNSGSAMTDTFPAAGTNIVNGTTINVANADATATDTLTAGAGTTIDTTSTFVVQPTRDLWFSYDAANTTWRPISNTRYSVVFVGTPPTATQLFGGNSIPGATSTVSIGTCLQLSGSTLSDTCDGTVTSVGITAPSIFGVGGSPVTGSGTLALTFATGQTQNQFLASPNGSSGAVGMRAIVAADVPTLNQNTSGSAGSLSATLGYATGGTGLTSLPTNGQIDIGNGSGFTRTSLTAGSNITITPGAGSITIAAAGGGGATNYVVENTTYGASAGDNILADTSSAAFTITLPASPAQFATVCITDAAGTFGTKNLTIAGNSLNIMSSASNMTVSTNYATFCLEYYTATPGWRIK